MLLTRQLRQSDIMSLLTSQFIKLLVLADNINCTNYPLQIKDTGLFVIYVDKELYTDAIFFYYFTLACT